jgi:hypothetical protein
MVTPGDMTAKFISMLIDGIEKDLLSVIWQVVEATPSTGNVMLVVWLS